MSLKKHIDKLEAKLLPELERTKQHLLRRDQQSTLQFRRRTVDYYRMFPYESAWIRKQNGIDNPWAEAIDRYYAKQLVDKVGLTARQVADFLDGTVHSDEAEKRPAVNIPNKSISQTQAQLIPTATCEVASGVGNNTSADVSLSKREQWVRSVDSSRSLLARKIRWNMYEKEIHRKVEHAERSTIRRGDVGDGLLAGKSND